MFRDFSKCVISITDEPFSNPGLDFVLKKTIIQFYDPSQKLLNEITVGHLDKELFYLLLDKDRPVKLENILFTDISFEEYRRTRNYEKTRKVSIPEISLNNCFFQAKEGSSIDFSHADFSDKTSFNNSVFLSSVSFENSKFYGETVLFEYCLFECPVVSFSHAYFGETHLSFKNTIFRKCEKRFENMKIIRGEKIFQNTDFGDGEISFYGTNFGKGIVSFKVSRFGKGRKNFDHALFDAGEAVFERANFGEGNISFKSAHFNDCRVDFTRSTFGEGQKIFVNTNFGHGNVSFVNTNFGPGKVSFRSAVFNGEIADFHYSVFGEGDIVFERTNFRNTALDFRSVRFDKGEVSFYRTFFGNHDIDFEASECSGSFKFEYTEFGQGKLNFHMVEFEKANVMFEQINFNNDIVNFNLARIKELTMKSCEFNKYFDLRVAKCEKIDFTESIIRDIIDINPYENNFNVDKIDFSGLILLGRIYIDWKQSKIRDKIYELETDMRNISDQFRMLKQNYYTIGNYEYEDKAYVEYKRTEMIADLKDSLRDNPYTAPFAYLKYGFKWLVFDKTGKFATNPIRVLSGMIIVYFSFMILYMIFPLFTDSNIIYQTKDSTESLSLFAQSFYFSGVTFFAIGYGDYHPTGIIRWFAIFEGFLGMFMMSYLAVAFVRKMLR